LDLVHSSPIEQSWLAHVRSQHVIAVIRTSQFEQGIGMAKAVAAAGMELIEITWNSDRAAQLVANLRVQLPHCQIGAGTLLTLSDLHEAIASGAQFLFTPHFQFDWVQQARQHQIPIIPGALTPSEIVAAWQAGATCVKVFPVQAVGGADYIRHLQGPLGQIPLIPTGGVTLENAKDYLQAGAIAVGLAGQLFPKQAVILQDWATLTQIARTLLQNLQRDQVPS
jgi:2-dehydro-3-deoxyphosphogluconate aldolase / (4S)-4-hydroxy-2-oxoglutarate aldolase